MYHDAAFAQTHYTLECPAPWFALTGKYVHNLSTAKAKDISKFRPCDIPAFLSYKHSAEPMKMFGSDFETFRCYRRFWFSHVLDFSTNLTANQAWYILNNNSQLKG